MTETASLREQALVCSLKQHGGTGGTVRMVDHDDLGETPEAVAPGTTTLAPSAAHLARLLTSAPYSSAG